MPIVMYYIAWILKWNFPLKMHTALFFQKIEPNPRCNRGAGKVHRRESELRACLSPVGQALLQTLPSERSAVQRRVTNSLEQSRTLVVLCRLASVSMWVHLLHFGQFLKNRITMFITLMDHFEFLRMICAWAESQSGPLRVLVS